MYPLCQYLNVRLTTRDGMTTTITLVTANEDVGEFTFEAKRVCQHLLQLGIIQSEHVFGNSPRIVNIIPLGSPRVEITFKSGHRTGDNVFISRKGSLK